MAEKWEGKHYSFFQNTQCEYFPCHKTAKPEEFNCIFCYCPLDALVDRSGPYFRYTEKGYKDCTNCMIPHKRQNFGHITSRYQDIAELTRRKP